MRFKSLDGLRGLAAVVVVVSHWVSIYNKSPGSPFESNPLLEIISLVFGNLASHAVWLFFMLSGFVLSKSFTARPLSYWRYLLGRGIRLYVPTVSAIAITYLIILVIPRSGIQDFNWWMSYHPESPGVLDFLHDVTLIFGGSGTMLVLWSLTYEIWFSILLKPLLSLMKHLNSFYAVLFLPVFSGLGNWFEVPTLQYLPMFMIGIGLQKLFTSRHKEESDQKRLTIARELVFSMASLLLLSISYLTLFKLGYQKAAYAFDVTFSLLSFSLLIYISIHGSYLKRILESRIVLYFGSISFSLYLVHETVLVNAVIVSGNNFAFVSAGVIVAFIAAQLFERTIEQKSHSWARKVLSR